MTAAVGSPTMTTLEGGTHAYDVRFTTGSHLTQTEPRVQLVTLYTRILRELSGNSRISVEKLARQLDVTMRTAQRHLERLEKEGFITVSRERRPFTYEVHGELDVPYLPGWAVAHLIGWPG